MQRKLSVIILAMMKSNDTEQKYSPSINELVGLAVIAWNASLLPEKEAKEFLESSFSQNDENEEFIRAIVTKLISYKLEHHRDDKRFILNYEFTGVNNNELVIASTQI